ncbi:MAG: hypothetical protein C0424_07805 [Sphingobacteriaceae bacterium]|nr:hypothetical protein [Sphingobacteriaceae bacterium]
MISLQVVFDVFEGDLWGGHLILEADWVADLLADGNRRILCSIKGAPAVHAALMPMRGQYFILVNKQLRAKLGLVPGQTVPIILEKDTSEFGMPVPDEMVEVFAQDETAYSHFMALTPGKQRALLHVVGKIKNTDSRIRKALAICYHLNESNGKLDFKRLGEVMKEYNQTK